MTSSKKREKLQWVRSIIKQIVSGLEEIHNLGYVYRDLKPSNILISHSGKIQICDFGFVIQENSLDSSLCGTPDYMAPERLSNNRKNIPLDCSVDMWSLGILTY